MVGVLKPLEDITAKPDTNIVFDTILKLKIQTSGCSGFWAQSCCGSSTLMGNRK
ncbi:hypothetical protein CesoFtcFv8_007767 [Champsocephalus esox]|uniref:Uncharacterized protein n=1 Tax=Champsocephalus esox TaxID=159716 RepID=A0AAN8CI31_9TELE|nr:hypothetical protein CesoFtcFv8_007767 [Champsocephalus esox]